jgi:hypothetical protein
LRVKKEEREKNVKEREMKSYTKSKKWERIERETRD